MKFNKSFLISIISLSTVLLVLVVFKVSSHSRFRSNASKWAEKSIDHSNLVTLAEVEKMQGKIMLIFLNPRPDINFATAIHTTSEGIMDRENIRKMNKHEGPKILVADDADTAARVWMLLSQIGMGDLYILEE